MVPVRKIQSKRNGKRKRLYIPSQSKSDDDWKEYIASRMTQNLRLIYWTSLYIHKRDSQINLPPSCFIV